MRRRRFALALAALTLAGTLSAGCGGTVRTVTVTRECLVVEPLDQPPPDPPSAAVAAELDSDDPATRRRALEQLDAYLDQLEPWAWAAERACRVVP